MSPDRPEPLVPRPPAPLLVATALVGAEGGVFLVLGLLELGGLSLSRVTMGLTTALFFLLYGAGLGACAWALFRVRSWARAPVVLAQLIQLGVAWSFRSGSTTAVAAALAVVAVAVLAGVLNRASMAALDAAESSAV